MKAFDLIFRFVNPLNPNAQPQMQRSPIPNNLSQMSPLSLVTHASQHQNRLMGAPQVGQLPNIFPHDIEKRMMEYINLLNPAKDMKRESITQEFRPNSTTKLSQTGSQSPDVSRETLHAIEMSRMASLFGMSNMYHPNASSPNHHTTSPPEVQREALNLQRESPSPIPPSPTPLVSIKREREHTNDVNDYHTAPKRGFIRSDMDLSRKSSSINNNHHLIKNNNNPHVTPTKVSVDESAKDRSQSPPSIDNDERHHHRSPPSHSKQQQNGIDSFSSMMMNGMQFKIVSKGESKKKVEQLPIIITSFTRNKKHQQKIRQPASHSWS